MPTPSVSPGIYGVTRRNERGCRESPHQKPVGSETEARVTQHQPRPPLAAARRTPLTQTSPRSEYRKPQRQNVFLFINSACLAQQGLASRGADLGAAVEPELTGRQGRQGPDPTAADQECYRWPTTAGTPPGSSTGNLGSGTVIQNCCSDQIIRNWVTH
ncbi:unnamed protein product [Boreogadus saida]